MRTEIGRFRELMGDEPLKDFAPDRYNTVTAPAKRGYVGKSAGTADVKGIKSLLYNIEELTGYEVGKAMPLILFVSLFNLADAELQDGLEKLAIPLLAESEAVKQALTEGISYDKRGAMALALSDLIRYNVYDESAADITYPLTVLKRLLFD